MNASVSELIRPRPHREPVIRWPGGSLTFRLALTINLAVFVVSAAFWALDDRRERDLHLGEQHQRLREEAKVLRVAQHQFGRSGDFQAYIDAYCRQMERHISPGHHIIVTDGNRRVVARAHMHSDPVLEQQMAVLRGDTWRRFAFQDEDHLGVAVPGKAGTSIVVAQSLAPVHRVIRRQAMSRALGFGVLSVLLLLTINLVLVEWVRRPVRHLLEGVRRLGHGHFSHRVGGTGASEFRELAEGFNGMAAALERVDMRRRYEMNRAHRLHMGLLPSADVAIPGLAWAARYVPTQTVGGDYHDVLPCPDGRYLLVIADVSGHGVPAALVMAMIKGLLHQLVGQGCPLAGLVRTLNRQIESLTGSEYFVTFLAVAHSPGTGTIEYVNCGHEPGVLSRQGGETRTVLHGTGPPLGVLADVDWEIGHLEMGAGDRLYLVTDGLFETEGPDGAMLGRERLVDLIAGTVGESPQESADRIIESFRRYQAGQPFLDDVTLLALWWQE